MTDGLTEEQIDFRERFEGYREAQSMNCRSIDEVLGVFMKWLYLEAPDVEFIEVALAAALDRELPGDPVWLMLVAPSGGLKSEVIRALSGYHRAYSLDLLTPHTFVSGLTRRNPDTDELEPVGGLLRAMDNHVLLLKDFTTVLSSDEGTRSEIYGQLRSIYDGYFEKGFGTLPEPIRVHSIIGIVAGVTFAIDKYTKMAGLLGERFLMIRSSPDRVKATTWASRNVGKESQMRRELRQAVVSFTQSLDYSHAPRWSSEDEEELIRVGYYIGKMRAHIWARYYQGEIYDMDIAESEIPTRVTKQLKKLGQLLALVRGHEVVDDRDISTLKRVAKDTCKPKRQRIIDAFQSHGLTISLGLTDITNLADGLSYKPARNQACIMEALDILMQEENGLYRITQGFLPFVKTMYHIPSPPVKPKKKPKYRSFSEVTGGEGNRVKLQDKLEALYVAMVKVDRDLYPAEAGELIGVGYEEALRLLRRLAEDGLALKLASDKWRAL